MRSPFEQHKSERVGPTGRRGAPSWMSSRSASIASRDPCAQISTRPSAMLRTKPIRPSSSARARVHQRKPTPWTCPRTRIVALSIGSQGRRGRVAALFPHPPFNPCMRFSRTRLTDGLLCMVTLPSGNGYRPRAGPGPGRGTRPTSTCPPDQRAGCGPLSDDSVRAATTRSGRVGRTRWTRSAALTDMAFAVT